MFKNYIYISLLGSLALALLIGPAAAKADSLTLITTPSAQQATDSINWAILGGDQTSLSTGGAVRTSKGATAQFALAGANSVLSKVCSAAPCSWTGTGFSVGDTLLWTSDASNGGTGPVTLTFATGITGAGAAIQADGPGPFRASIQAYNGSTLLGSFTVSSDSQGHPVYIGVLDQTGPHITSVVFNLASVTAGLTSDFGLDSVTLSAPVGPGGLLSPASLGFASQSVGTTSTLQAITLKNTGTASLAIRGYGVTGDFKVTSNCPSSLPIAASCIFNIAFAPTATGGRTGVLWVGDYLPGQPQTAALTGTGISAPPPPGGHLSLSSLSFATQRVGTTSTAQQLTLKNIGTSPLTIRGYGVTGDFKVTSNCPSALPVGASCMFNIAFAPTATGPRTGVFWAGDYLPGQPQTATLAGSGE